MICYPVICVEFENLCHLSNLCKIMVLTLWTVSQYPSLIRVIRVIRVIRDEKMSPALFG
jgi:hypothetical protein